MFFKALPHLTVRCIEDEFVLYDSASEDVHMLNATAGKVFQMCDGSHTPEEIAEALVEFFDEAEYATVCEDVKQILNTFQVKKLVTQVEG